MQEMVFPAEIAMAMQGEDSRSKEQEEVARLNKQFILRYHEQSQQSESMYSRAAASDPMVLRSSFGTKRAEHPRPGVFEAGSERGREPPQINSRAASLRDALNQVKGVSPASWSRSR